MTEAGWRSSSWDGRLRLLDAASLAEQAVLDVGYGRITSAVFSPDDRLLAATAGDGTILLADADRPAVRATLIGHASEVTSAVFSQDGRQLVSASVDRTLRIWGRCHAAPLERACRSPQHHPRLSRGVPTGK